jgi:O-methyltransferase domain
VVGGSFFELVPSGGDAYVLKHIVRDWDESKGLEIFAQCPDDDREHLSKLLDDYAELLRRARFRNTRVIPTVGPASIVESEAA